MIKEILNGWSWKSFFLGILTISFALGVNWELPYSETTLLLRNGMNAFWMVGFLLGCLPLAIILMYENYKSKFIKRDKNE